MRVGFVLPNIGSDGIPAVGELAGAIHGLVRGDRARSRRGTPVARHRAVLRPDLCAPRWAARLPAPRWSGYGQRP